MFALVAGAAATATAAAAFVIAIIITDDELSWDFFSLAHFSGLLLFV